MKKSIVAIMAHSDDIDIFAGGTFAKYMGKGYKGLYGVLSRCNSGWTITENKGGHYLPSVEIIPQRKKEAQAAADVYGAELYYEDLLENCYTKKDGSLLLPGYKSSEAMSENEKLDGTLLCVASGAGTWENHPVVENVVDILIKWEPEIIIAQCIQNLNPDHFSAAMIVAKAWLIAKEKVDIGPVWLPLMQDQHAFPKLNADIAVDVTGYTEMALKGVMCHISQGLGIVKYREPLIQGWEIAGKRHGCKCAEEFSLAFSEEGTGLKDSIYMTFPKPED
jgi:LmbE family N-acetylglucosaminyl deacetylase